MYQRFNHQLPNAIKNRIPPTWHYVGETPYEYIFVDASENHLGGSIGNMFKRMFKFTPKSFRPANIFRAAYRLTPVSLALQVAAPKLERKIYEKVAPIAVPAIAGASLAYAFGPQLISMLGPKLAQAGSLIGEHAGTIGKGLMSVMGGLAAPKQAEVAQAITPEQIAQIEQTGQVPEPIQRILNEGVQQAYYPPPPPYAMSPEPIVPPSEPETTQAGAMEMNPQIIAIIGGLAIVGLVLVRR